MKTILIAHNFSEKSINAMSFHLAKYLAKNNKVIFVSHDPKFEKTIEFNELNGRLIVYSWPYKNRPSDMNSAIWYAKLFNKYKPEIVIGHFIGGLMAILISKLLSFFKVKTVNHYHTIFGSITNSNRKKIFQKLYKFRTSVFYNLFCDKIICPSEFSKSDLKKNFRYSNSIVLPNAIKENIVFKNLNENQIEISFLGRMDSNKGIMLLISVFLKYSNENPNTKLKLNIAGYGENYKVIEEISLNNKNINFVGGLDYNKVPQYFSESNYTIIPSYFDNLPTVGLESLMQSTPLLISENTGLTSFIKDNVNSFIFKMEENSIYNLLVKIEKAEFDYSSISKEARNLFENEFSMNSYISNFEKIITSI